MDGTATLHLARLSRVEPARYRYECRVDKPGRLISNIGEGAFSTEPMPIKSMAIPGACQGAVIKMEARTQTWIQTTPAVRRISFGPS